MKRIITRHEIMGWFRKEYSMFPVQDIEGLFKGLSDEVLAEQFGLNISRRGYFVM